MPVERIRFVHTLMPGARLILILRNPIDRCWSETVYNLRRNASAPPLEDILHDVCGT